VSATRREADVRALLAHIPVFSALGAPQLARLAAATTRRRLRREEVLFRRGEPPTGVYAVVYGQIALTARAPGGERVTDIIGPGRSFGEAILFLGKPTIVGAAALGDALVLHVAKEAIFAELERSPAFARRIIAALSAKLEATVRELDTYALGSSGRRFAAWLLRTARGQPAVTLPASKRAVASRLNLSAEHLSRILRELADESAHRGPRAPACPCRGRFAGGSGGKLSTHQAFCRPAQPPRGAGLYPVETRPMPGQP
jgi:CRP-like cAMP-binding protein